MELVGIMKAARAVAVALVVIAGPWAARAQGPDRDRNESVAVGTLRSCGSAEAVFIQKFKRPATLDELVELQYLRSGYGNGTVHDGYRLTQGVVDPKTMAWEIKAEPVDADHGARAYNVCEDFVIRYREGTTAPDRKDGKGLGE